MSQYIKLNDPLIQYQEAHKNVLQGALSKISLYRTSVSMAYPPNPNYIKQKISLRFKKEEGTAYQTHQLSLCENYVKLKLNLQSYAKSKSLKLQNAFERQTIRTSKLIKEEVGRLSYKPQKKDRVIFIDRKYNRQFAIEKAISSQIDQISREKNRIKKMLSEKHLSPLASQVKLKCTTRQKQNLLTLPGNPVLDFDKGNKLIKKKKVNRLQFFNKKKGSEQKPQK